MLSIEGTHKNDKIVVSLAGEDLSQLAVKINKSTTLFNAAEVTSLVINAGNGNDRVIVADNVLIPAQIFGGKGNDWLTGGGASDVIYRRASRPYRRVDVAGTLHNAFSDMVLWGGPLAGRPMFGTLPGDQAVTITRQIVREYFDQELLGRESRLLSGSTTIPGVRVH